MSASITNINRGVHLSISAFSAELGLSRETVRRRLADGKVIPSGQRSGYPVFRLKDALPALIDSVGVQRDPDQMDPFKRKAWYQSELESLKLQQDRRELIPRIESEQEMAALLKIVAEAFDTLPDILERDCGLPAATLLKVETVLDKRRDDLYLRLTEDEDANSAAGSGE